MVRRGWGFSSVKEHLPGKCKALSSVPSTGEKKKKEKIEKKKQNRDGKERLLVHRCEEGHKEGKLVTFLPR
jgi:hypothetical protein